MDFISAQGLLFTSKKYEDIYIKFKDEYSIGYADLFCLACSIGFVENLKQKVEEKGRELRVNFLNSDERATIIYTILLEDEDLNINLEDLLDKDRFYKYRKTLEEYAEGGMYYLTKNIFPSHIKDNTAVKAYNDYIIDIMSYAYDKSEETPF